jgi:hypothetical protein
MTLMILLSKIEYQRVEQLIIIIKMNIWNFSEVIRATRWTRTSILAKK